MPKPRNEGNAGSKSKAKTGKSKDALLRTSPKGAVQLSEDQLDKVAGGAKVVTPRYYSEKEK